MILERERQLTGNAGIAGSAHRRLHRIIDLYNPVQLRDCSLSDVHGNTLPVFRY